jgi:hypothetical protein
MFEKGILSNAFDKKKLLEKKTSIHEFHECDARARKRHTMNSYKRSWAKVLRILDVTNSRR